MFGKKMIDPWQKCKTLNGFNADEIISALQKSIRRGKEEDAAKFAYELYATSPELEAKCWQRLLTISVEDIGMGNPMASVIINSLSQMRKNFDYLDVDRSLYMIHAVRVLCESKKDRSSDILKNICLEENARGIVPEIPDYALDKHTRRGQEMGRGLDHFYKEASKVHPQMEIENNYAEKLKKILESK